MAKTAIALYNDFATAQQVVQELKSHGFSDDNISLVANDASGEYSNSLSSDMVDDDVSSGEGAAVGAVEGGLLGLLAGLGALLIPGIGPVLAAGPLIGALTGAAAGALTGGLAAGLMDMGLPETDANSYTEGVRRGGTLVTVRADDARLDEAVVIMNRYNPVDVERSSDQWRSSGWTGSTTTDTETHTDINRDRDFVAYQADTDTTLTTDLNATNLEREGEVTLPVVEEELKVGKRAVQQGGVRVHTHVENIPVEESVTLREEHVTVDRRPVDRPVDAATMNSLQEGSIEVTTMAEEAVVSKEARVVEEVVIRKDVDTRTERITDTVRRTDVQVDEIGAEREMAYQTFDTYDTSFRNHWSSTYPSSRYTYDQYSPAYRYGYSLGTDERFRGRSWEQIEPEARGYWEERNPNTWEEFKGAVRHAWNELTD